MKTSLLTLSLLLLLSCSSRAPALKPGSAGLVKDGDKVTQTVTQPESPGAAATQSYLREEETQVTDVGGVRQVTILRETHTASIGAAQDDVATRGWWAKGKAKAEDVKAFMRSQSPLMFAGILGLGLLAFSFTPYGRAIGLSREGKLILGAASLLLLIMPAISLGVRENAMGIIMLAVAGFVVWYIKERKEEYKVKAAAKGAL